MSFLNPLGLLAFAAVPAVLALHLYRRKLKERRVAALFLFGRDDLLADAGRVRTRLLRSPSLWCELAAAALLALALGGLTFDLDATRAHVVVVLDDSASLQAVHDGRSAADRARLAAEKILAAEGRDAVATVVTTGERPELLFGPRGAVALADDALRAWTPRRPRHDPARALAFAVELAGPADRVVYVTDEPDAAVPSRVEIVGVGAPLANAAVLSARRARRSATEESVQIDVAAHGGGPRAARVRLFSGDDPRTQTVIGETTVEIAPGRLGRASFVAPRSDDIWRVALDPDSFAPDDDAFLLPEPRRPVRVATLLSEEAAGLLSLKRAFASLDDVAATKNPLDADLVFAPTAGRLERGVVEVVVGAAGEARSDWVGPYLFDRRHPLTAGLSLQGVVWSAGDGDVPGQPLVFAGEQALLAEEQAPDGSRVRLNLDPARSNLTNAPDWPVFLANLVDRVRRALPGPVAVNVRVGEEMTWRVRGTAVDASTFELTTPDGRKLPGRGLRTIGFVGDRPGVYVLRRDGAELARFAVRFADPRESDLTGLATKNVPAATPPRAVDDAPGRDGAGRRERRLLVALLLVAVALDWVFLRRGGAA